MPEYTAKAVSVIGIGDDGCSGLNGKAMNALMKSQVLVGGERHLAFFPDFSGVQITIKGYLNEILDRIEELSGENHIAVLASGDPMFFGIGSRLIEKLGREHVEVIPHPGAMQYAFSKIGIKWDDCEWISLHGRKNHSFITSLKRMSKVIFFTDDRMNPAAIAEKMLCYGETSWEAWLCENLSGPGEKVTEFSKIENLARLAEYSPLNVLIIRRTDPSWKPIPMFNHFSEDQYAKRMPSKGLITKKEVRMFSIAQLALRNDSVIWDIGAASGSVAIECAMAADRGHAYAVEMNHESIAHCRENLLNFAVDNVTVIEGKAPEILSEIPEDPDAVFVGGSSGSLSEIINTVFVRLKVSGRMVVNAVTIENIHEAHETFKKMSLVPEITMLNLSRCIPLARFMRYEALNPIHIFCITKKEEKIK